MIWAVILAVHTAIQFSDLPEDLHAKGARLALVLWIVSLTLMACGWRGIWFATTADRFRRPAGHNPVAESVATGGVLPGSGMDAVGLPGRYTPHADGLGRGGLAVALALQDTLSNLFAGFYVAVARQVRLGDYIKLNSGEAGYVTDIGWRNTTIRELANNVIIVPIPNCRKRLLQTTSCRSDV